MKNEYGVIVMIINKFEIKYLLIVFNLCVEIRLSILQLYIKLILFCTKTKHKT